MYLIGIAGGSGSGKTTFAKRTLQKAGSAGVVLLHQDSYYLSSPPSHLKIHGEPNFDHPEAFDWPLLKDHLTRLKAGEQIAAPIYDYKISRRTDETELIGPCNTTKFR
jgi:uridine kinase